MKKMILIFMTLLLLIASQANAWNYPRDGKFKQLNPRRDPWCFVDENWDITAPDKWQHIMGSYVLQSILQKKMNKYLAAGLILGGGAYKEFVEDAYREGWSARDLACDIIGVASAMFFPKNIVATYKWGPEKNVVLHLVIPLNP